MIPEAKIPEVKIPEAKIPEVKEVPAPVASPPAAVAAVPARATVPATSGLASQVPEHIAGMLAYFIVPAAVFLLVRPFNRNRFVRFHSLQCLLTVAVLVVVQLSLALLGKLFPLLVLSLYGLLLLADFALWLLLLFKAFRHEEFKLPVIGNIAERWAEKH